MNSYNAHGPWAELPVPVRERLRRNKRKLDAMAPAACDKWRSSTNAARRATRQRVEPGARQRRER